MWVMVVIVLVKDANASASLLVHKYSTRVVRTKYGPLRGVMIHIHPPVEAFLGVPYATPPVGSLRFVSTVTHDTIYGIKAILRYFRDINIVYY